MKLEAGKFYTDGNKVVKCVAILNNHENRNWPYVCVLKDSYSYVYPFLVDINGDPDGIHKPQGLRRITSEWKEPVVHKRDIVWLKSAGGNIYCFSYPVGTSDRLAGTELHRETVTYTEK